jgi:hypothetical protein
MNTSEWNAIVTSRKASQLEHFSFSQHAFCRLTSGITCRAFTLRTAPAHDKSPAIRGRVHAVVL